MADRLINVRTGWRGPVFVGLVGVLLFVAAGFSRLTNPPLPLMLSFALGGLSLLSLWFYLRSDAHDREERMTASLGEMARERLRKQRPLSIALAIALIALVSVPFGMSYFSEWFGPLVYNGMIGVCMIGMVFWCVVAAIGHAVRHGVLDEHERALADSEPTVH